MKKKLVAMMLSMAMVLTATGCGSETTPDATETNAGADTKTEQSAETTDTKVADTTAADTTVQETTEPVVIRYGTHWVNDLDPNHVDEVTGEYTMSETNRQAALAALEAVKSELNVEFEFIQYSGDVRNDLMTSVLAGNPICDIALIWGGAEGTILAQNVLQQLDDYADIFADEESSWMFYDQLYGHNYLLSNVVRYKQRWPLIFNLTMLDQVDALKDENGETIYPMDLYLDGEWTWSTFEDYLSKIQAHYANVAAPDGCVYDTVQAYETDHRFAGLSAIYSNGGAIYGSDGLEADAENTIEGMKYIADLMDKELMTDPGVYDDGYTPQWTTAASDFSAGGTVFTDCPDWWIGGNASTCAERGESIGIVAWPRPDDVAIDSEEYKQAITLGDSVGVLKGVDEEKTRLALEAYKLYWTTYYKVLGGVDSMAEYKEQNMLSELAAMGLDIYNEDFGDDLIECFSAISNNLSNDYADLLGLRVAWDDIMGKSLYGIDGMSSYDVSVKANASDFTNVISDMEAILASNEIKDNQAPSFTTTDAVIALGTDAASIDWTQYFTATDSVDGELDMATAELTVKDGLDLATAGKYEKAVEAKIADKSGNSATGKLNVVVYNADNTTAPTITVAEELPTVAIDTDASTIGWSGSYIASAVDADGLDVSANIVADLSELDTTTAGTYNVVITVTDFAGNAADVTLEVTVAAAE